MRTSSRYHPLLVVLHWLLAVLIVGALGLGYFFLAPMLASDPRKIVVLEAHMAGGMVILALMIVRFFVRIRTARPPLATSGHPRLDRSARFAHVAFYILVLLMAGTGLATAIAARLNEIVFQHSGAPLPATFAAFPAFRAHGYVAALLAVLIALHVLAALYHQLVRKDRLLGRMRFGERRLDP
jgi:cytochrome b561